MRDKDLKKKKKKTKQIWVKRRHIIEKKIGGRKRGKKNIGLPKINLFPSSVATDLALCPDKISFTKSFLDYANGPYTSRASVALSLDRDSGEHVLRELGGGGTWSQHLREMSTRISCARLPVWWRVLSRLRGAGRTWRHPSPWQRESQFEDIYDFFFFFNLSSLKMCDRRPWLFLAFYASL